MLACITLCFSESSSIYTDYGRVHCRFRHLTGLSVKKNLEYFTSTNETSFNKSGVRMFHIYIYIYIINRTSCIFDRFWNKLFHLMKYSNSHFHYIGWCQYPLFIKSTKYVLCQIYFSKFSHESNLDDHLFTN